MQKKINHEQRMIRRAIQNQPYPFQPNKKKQPTNKTLNNKIKAIEKKQDLKWADEFSSLTCSSTGNGITVNNIAGGNTAVTRIGNKISMTSFQFKYNLATSASQLTASSVRVMVVIDRLHNFNGATFDAVYFGPTGLMDNSIITDIRYMPRNHNTLPRYKVLYDKIHTINPDSVNVAGTSVIPKQIHVTKNFKLNHIVTYDGAGGAVADIGQNALCLFVACDSVIANAPVFQYGSRVYFKDD